MEQNQNMRLFECFRTTPEEAKKTIQGGRLKGFTDINPMWRIKRLTEVFGPCGIGWKFEIVSQRIQQGYGEEAVAFVDILLYYRNGNEWSEGIPGLGGAAFISKEKTGIHTSDECFKMALTDAIGTACKALGMSADIFYEKDRTKYTTEPEKKNPVDEAAMLVVNIAPYVGMKLGDIWKKDINFIKFLRDDPGVSQEIKTAISVISESSKRAR